MQTIQAAHAAGESSPGNLPAGTNVVLLGVPDEAALEQLAKKLRAGGLTITRIEEPDPPWNGQLMALGIAPGRREVLQRHLSSLPLLK